MSILQSDPNINLYVFLHSRFIIVCYPNHELKYWTLLLLLGAVHKLRHPPRGGGGVFKKMTLDDIGGRGGQSKDDR
jgi:hypothetical protein